MGILELFITAVALSMDAFAVAMCKGLATPKLKIKHMLLAGLWFGGFQALMPLIGYLLGGTFGKYITVTAFSALQRGLGEADVCFDDRGGAVENFGHPAGKVAVFGKVFPAGIGAVKVGDGRHLTAAGI